MRAVLFKNLTSQDRRRKVISSAEIIEQAGTRTEIHRHFICFIREVDSQENKLEKIAPQIFVIKKHHTQLQSESFLCRLKGGIYVASGKRVFLVYFIHSLRINLISSATPTV